MARWHVLLCLLALIQLALGQLVQQLAKETFSDLEFFEQVSAASYCSENNLGPNIRLKCRTGNCPHVDQAEMWTVLGLSNAPNTDVTGFVACDYTHNTTIIAFRGSESRLNWKMNFEVSLVDVDFCPGCQAAQGFWKSWTESRDPILAAINASQKFFPQNRIVVTGHSLGGAVATLAAGALRKTGLKVDLYTYGSPRVGNEDLAVQMTLQSPLLGNNYRVTHLNDAVPQLPPMWFGYKHISPEFYISSDTGKNVTLTNITALPDFESHLGNYQWNRMSINAHGWYFSPISACYNGPPLDLGWTVVNGTGDKKVGKPTPDQDWLTAVLGQLSSFIPIPPKGIAPLSVPAGPNSHGKHPPDTGPATPDKDKPAATSPPPSPGGADSADSPYYTGEEDDERMKKITKVPTKVTFTTEKAFPDMTREEMEKYFGFDKTKFDVSKARRRMRRLVPYGGARKYLI